MAPSPVTSAAESARWRDLARARGLALLLDLDGTLVELAPTPEQAVPGPDVVALLNALVETGVRIVVVSGRPRSAIEPLRSFVPAGWWIAEHGSWRWDPDLAEHPQTPAPELDLLLAALAPHVAVDGVRIERKSLSVCVHWREVPETERADLIAVLETACDEWLEEHPQFERIGGVLLVEVRQRAVHKGTIVNWVRERAPGTRIIAIGDDVTDEDMFAELETGDASIAVGPRPRTADARASGVRDVEAFLAWVLDVRAGKRVEIPIAIAHASDAPHRYRLVVMSNRTPMPAAGRTREVGGLISALEPALREEHGIWLGWSGQERGHDSRVVVDDSEQPARARFDLPVAVRQSFYIGFCNSVLWPLFHGFPGRVRVGGGDWAAYVDTNRRFARHAHELAWPSATVWVHDYHLLLAARELRMYGHRGRIGLFLHIPFPAVDLLRGTPWVNELLSAMCDFDLIGFQTETDAAAFLQAAAVLVPRSRVPETGVFPATIDPGVYHRRDLAESRDVAGLRAALGDRRLVLGVDRLDYSKGIPERLLAYEKMLERHPEWRRQVSFLQISVPTRAEIPDYAELRARVEALVGRINGQYGDTDWVPVRYLYRSYDQDVLAHLYRLADVALVTPLRDGMNLVAKEFLAAQDPAAPGVLVLSQLAGAAASLAEAVITNPYHPDALADDLNRALTMPLHERTERHRALLATLEREGDARAWARRFLDRLAPTRLRSVD